MFPSTSTSSSSSASPLILQAARRLMLHNSPYLSSNKAAPPMTVGRDSSHAYKGESSFDANVVMVLSVLLCALICALGLNSIIRCALRYSNRSSYENGESSNTRLANTGVKRKALKTFPVVTYLAEKKLPGLDTECVICLSEFVTGERLRILPTCNHGFHIRCIDKWLMAHSSCPTCRHCLINTCQKIVGCTQTTSSAPPVPAVAPQLQAGTLVPLEHEGFIRNLHSIC